MAEKEARKYRAVLEPAQLTVLFQSVSVAMAVDGPAKKGIAAIEEKLAAVGRVEIRMEQGALVYFPPKEKDEYEFTEKELYGVKVALIQAIAGMGQGRPPSGYGMTKYTLLPIADAFGKAFGKMIRKDAALDVKEETFDLGMEEEDEAVDEIKAVDRLKLLEAVPASPVDGAAATPK